MAKYKGMLEERQLPLMRAYRPTPREALIRELILQLKKGWLDGAYYKGKFGVDVFDEWRSVWESYRDEGYLTFDEAPSGSMRAELTREGLLRADALLPAFFEPQHQGVRYT
jgi:oxygen-independent coproporphyrinogen-3 oxidase